MASPVPGVNEDDWDLILKHLSRLLEQGTIVYIYGSRQRGSHKTYSDLDISLKAPSKISSTTMRSLADILAESDITYKIDLTDFNNLDTDFQTHILENSVAVDL